MTLGKNFRSCFVRLGFHMSQGPETGAIASMRSRTSGHAAISIVQQAPWLWPMTKNFFSGGMFHSLYTSSMSSTSSATRSAKV
eukprot:CAMPEP_0115374904 /NCGR_PEP_ID=MMETSP0271-20121206/2188_1 /TAXON_ID=71861 /ORGANISM="Scrippsiella trochoidea, Strain CCMP3099" /LENGTH=82 /DNA_ID=CAMNT_0002797953 /DNA_START=509 /DNA_END=757 /DNA_ORIENTATION=-